MARTLVKKFTDADGATIAVYKPGAKKPAFLSKGNWKYAFEANGVNIGHNDAYVVNSGPRLQQNAWGPIKRPLQWWNNANVWLDLGQVPSPPPPPPYDGA